MTKANNYITAWLQQNSIPAGALSSTVRVVSLESAKTFLEQFANQNYQEKAETLFEIVKPQTDKSLREITSDELRELVINFKDGL